MTDEVDKLIKILENISQGDYSNDIMAFTTGGYSENIQRVAEAVGMLRSLQWPIVSTPSPPPAPIRPPKVLNTP